MLILSQASVISCLTLFFFPIWNQSIDRMVILCQDPREAMQRNDQFGIVLLIVLIMDVQFQTGF